MTISAPVVKVSNSASFYPFALHLDASPLHQVTQAPRNITSAKGRNAPSETISHADAVVRYADYLKRQSWCVDASKWPLTPFHARSGRPAAIQHLTMNFSSWAQNDNLTVEGCFSAFIEALGDKLMQALPRFVGRTFSPESVLIVEKHAGVPLLNTYIPFRPERVCGMPMPPIFRDYLDRVFPNKEDERQVMDWCADIFQNPMRRPQYGIILTGEQGSGKSSVANLLRLALGGRHIWQHDDYSAAFDKYSNVFTDNLVVCFDDASPSKNTCERMKYLMTAKELSKEQKYVQGSVTTDVYARVLICTNRESPFDFDGDDRRYYACEPCKIKGSKEVSNEFFQRFVAWLHAPGTAEYLYNFFMDRNLSGFIAGWTVQTPTMKKMLGEVDESAETLKDTCMKLTGTKSIFPDDMLQERLVAAGHKLITCKSLSKVMLDLGYAKARRVVPNCRAKQVDVWQPNVERSRKLLAEEIAQIQKYAAPPQADSFGF